MPRPLHDGCSAMTIRDLASRGVGARLADGLERFNRRHPWSHNDHFHAWILANLPARRRAALDVGCGRGALLEALAPRFETVQGIDIDGPMREVAARRCTGFENVTVDDQQFGMIDGPFDLVTMVAVLHHLDLDEALVRAREVLSPDGRLLVVGLAVPRTPRDLVWEAASIVTNPLIGLVKHPWADRENDGADPFPVTNPRQTVDEIAEAAQRILPGAVVRRRLGFRYTLAWETPAA